MFEVSSSGRASAVGCCDLRNDIEILGIIILTTCSSKLINAYVSFQKDMLSSST